MDPGVRNLAGAGEQPALDGKEIIRRAGAGRAPSPGRGAGPGSSASRRASCAWKARVPASAARSRASSPKARARSDSWRADCIRLAERRRWSCSKRARASPALLKVAAAGAELDDRLAGLAAKRLAARHLGAHSGGPGADGGERGGEQGADVDDLVERAGLDQGERRRPPGHGLERGGEPDQRALACREAGALLGAEPLDQGDARLGRGDVRLGRLDPGGEGGGRGIGPGGLAGGALGLALEQLGAAPGGRGFLPRLGEGRPAGAWATARSPARRRERCDEENRCQTPIFPASEIGVRHRFFVAGGHRPILPCDRGGWQGWRWRARAARRASPGRADGARSPGRRRGAGRRTARSSSEKPSAPPIRKRASRRPSSRQRSRRLARSSEPSVSPFSSRRMVTLFSAGGGRRPPLSGNSVI